MTAQQRPQKASADLKVSFGGYSTAGQKPVNQDAFAAHQPPDNNSRRFKGAAAAIADGVSSCQDSHIASQTSVTSFIEDYFSTPHSWSVKQSVSRVVTGLNSWLHQQNNVLPAHRDSMLTTFSALIIKSSTLYTFHVGDSRIYQWRNQQLEQLTNDHSRTERGRNYLSRALGADRHLEVDFSQQDLINGDLLLLSTDGVHEYLSVNQLKALLSHIQQDSLETVAKRIVEQARANGSDDNLTVLLVRVDQLPAETLDESHRRLTRLPIPPVMKVGNRIDDYEVLDIIFSGTRSHMYKVRELSSGQIYTLKAPSVNFDDDPLYLDGFVREEWVGQQLNHPNVMKTFSPAGEKRFLYYLGEYIEGVNLRQWMDDHPHPSPDLVRPIIQQAIKGLRAFQRQDMVHQDLKPENIMLNRDGQVKILDFGTVLIAGINELGSPLDKSVPQGSVNYIAPEYLMGQKGSFRSDLFSLAVISYEMLTGTLPFKEHSVKQVSIANYSELSYRPAIHQRRDLPLWMEGCLQKALQPNPVHRYQALSEFIQDFTTPNQKLAADISKQPLIRKNPLLVWQIFCLLLLMSDLVLLYLYTR
ncbi:bifunctional protein-serine/threonine kinase/phosphatase [Amphritea pacifica]|uniref:Bifunctional protein-serine/threonine kinase/phosphatase n=1 Tax=Amphritea pacifica TaxID=2811233 RepID=A0ABS2W8A8_9GAMM|nr:bifunctional protein-serine/threonine kinase/phosphatase [Amphritea pacifica]MBN0987622.1 bifunctional protein-serine/threonine kinase/phosphatase [Amphritea pacifica]